MPDHGTERGRGICILTGRDGGRRLRFSRHLGPVVHGHAKSRPVLYGSVWLITPELSDFGSIFITIVVEVHFAGGVILCAGSVFV